MQANLERGKAAFSMRRVGLSVAILAGAPLIAALAICAPDPALAACGASSHPAGVHAGGGAGGVHVATAAATVSVARRRRRNASGVQAESSASALRGLPTASLGQGGRDGRPRGAHPKAHARTAATRTTNASAHLHAVRPAHRA